MSETGSPPRARRKGAAVASLFIGLFGFMTFGVGAVLSILLGLLALRNANREPEGYGGEDVARVGIGLGVLSLLFFAWFFGTGGRIREGMLVFPYRGPRDHIAVADVRIVLSAEEAYSKANAGFYDELRCLARPAECIPGYWAEVLPFLGVGQPERLLALRDGYIRAFHFGPRADAREVAKKKASPSSLRAFAYVVQPVGGSESTKSYCGDSTGRICATEGRMLPVTGGRCPQACVDIH